MFDLLKTAGALRAGAVTLEVGPATGLATHELIAAGAHPLTLVEPDERFAPSLSDLLDAAGNPVTLRLETFEACDLPRSCFDLVVIATAYHWLDPEVRVSKLADVTKPDGVVVLMWNVFQDLTQEDLFHEATRSLLSKLASSPSGAPDSIPFALDRAAREQEFLSSGQFRLSHYAESRWSIAFDAAQIRQLYEGFSQIARLALPERTALLDSLETIAHDDFNNQVVRNMTSPIYLFERI